MAASVPVVATRVGGNPEVVQGGITGLLVPPRDSDALARAIGQFLEQPMLGTKFGLAGRERVSKRFALRKDDPGDGKRSTKASWSGSRSSRVRPQSRMMKVLLVRSISAAAWRRVNARSHVAEACSNQGSGSMRTFSTSAGGQSRASAICRFEAHCTSCSCCCSYALERGWSLHVHINGHNTKSWLVALSCRPGREQSVPERHYLTIHSGMSPAYLRKSAAPGDSLPGSQLETLSAHHRGQS